LIDGPAWIVVLVQILCVDLLLGADNAIVIALACSRLPAEETRRAVMLGAVGAIALRLGMLAFANALLDVPLVKLVAAWTLIVIALNVRARKAGEEALVTTGGASAGGDFVTAAVVIMLADAAMSLDNVVALAAIAGGSFWLLALGIVLSIPIIVFGSLILSGIIHRAPAILTLGAVVLGWIAGGMAVSDPLVAGWVQANAPALAVFAPALGAAFVWLAGEGAERRSPRRAIEPARAVWIAPPPRLAVDPSQPVVADLEGMHDPAPEPAPRKEHWPLIAAEPPSTRAPGGWSEERAVVVGFVILAAIAGIIIFVASFLDSLT
jgi:YjbE family integral membrane protein